MDRNRIMVVEDEGVVARDIERQLKDMGYDVAAIAYSGEEAVEKAAELRPDLVLMDIVLAGKMDGIEAAEKINARVDIPIVYLTAYADEKTLSRAKLFGPSGYVLKPVEKSQLHVAIELALHISKVNRERIQAEEVLKESEARYYDLYDNAPDMYYSLDLATGGIKECNETLLRKTGYSKEELIGRPIFELYDSSSADNAKKSFQQFSVTGEVHDAERRVKCKDGCIIDVSLNVSAIRDKDGNVTHSRSIWHDITERKKQEEIICALSTTDQLTGLYNRRGFMAIAEQQLRVAERTQTGLLVLYADMDGLKQINDTLGHKSGDEAIVETANVLKEVFRKVDIIARMGGDEFAVLAPDATLEHENIIKNRLQDKLDTRNALAGRDYHLSLSIGVVYHPPPPPNSLDELISSADTLMYEQKRRNKSLQAQG